MTDTARLTEEEVVQGRHATIYVLSKISFQSRNAVTPDEMRLARYARHLEQEVERMKSPEQQIAALDGVHGSLMNLNPGEECEGASNKEAEMPRGSYTPSYPPNSEAGKAEVRQHGIPRCPICGAEMYDCGIEWKCGMKHEGDPPVEHRTVGDDPPNRYFDGMEATCEEDETRFTLCVGGFGVACLKKHPIYVVLQELARRWNTEPGLRDSLKLDVDYTAELMRIIEDLCRGRELPAISTSSFPHLMTMATEFYRRRQREIEISESRRQALVNLRDDDSPDNWTPEFWNQIDNAIDGKQDVGNKNEEDDGLGRGEPCPNCGAFGRHGCI